MSTLTLGPNLFEHPGTLFDEPEVTGPPPAQPTQPTRPIQPTQRTQPGASGLSVRRLPGPAGGHTLEDVIVGGWQRIMSGASASCPVCQGELRPVWSAGSRPVGARCQDCGSRLS